MDIILVPLLQIISYILSLCTWMIFLDVIINWLLIANVLRTNNRIIYMIIESIRRLADFLLDPLRRKLPYIQGVDISPVVFMLGAIFINNVIYRVLIRLI